MTFTVVPFFWTMYGSIPGFFIYIPMHHGPLVLVPSEVPNGFMVDGLTVGRVSISLFWNFFPILLSILIWGGSMRNQCILFFTDNEALGHAINRSSCRNPRLMFFVRHLVLACLKYNILFRARHVPGVHNQLAYPLSRLQVQRFRKLASQYMQPIPTVIPLALQPQNWRI